MNNSKYTNIRYILDRLMVHPLLQDLKLSNVVDMTISFMRIVGVPKMFEEKTAILEIENFRAALPDDFQEMIQVRKSGDNKVVYMYSQDSFHLSEDNEHLLNLTYKIQGGVIYTTTKDTPIEIAYRAIMVDECGLPMIPDNSSFTRALEAYIKKQWFTILFDLGKIQGPILQMAQQDYAWAVGDCQTEFHRMTIDQAESFYNSWRTLIMRNSQHAIGFKTNNHKERLTF